MTEQEFDERLIAKIIAAAEAPNRKIHRSRAPVVLGHNDWGARVDAWDTDGVIEADGYEPEVGSYCAVGAGLLYNGVKLGPLEPCVQGGDSPLRGFAKLHGVSYAYACGVSDGYEDVFPGASNSHEIRRRYGRTVSDLDLDYWRGVEVGRAIAQYSEVE